MHFALEIKANNIINSLDLSIHRYEENSHFSIYCKRTFPDITTPYRAISCHPPAHKYVGISYMFNRQNMYNHNTSERHKELIIIQNIHHNNPFSSNNAEERYRKQTKMNVEYENDNNRRQKWFTFTYKGKEILSTKLIKHNNLKVALHPTIPRK